MQKSTPRRTIAWMLALAAFGVARAVLAAPSAAEHHPVEGTTEGRAPAPADPAQPPQRPRFASSFEGYRPYRPDEPLRPWREVNDEVGRLGGHVGQLDARSRPDARSAHAHH